jgi:hypothetical protein
VLLIDVINDDGDYDERPRCDRLDRNEAMARRSKLPKPHPSSGLMRLFKLAVNQAMLEKRRESD